MSLTYVTDEGQAITETLTIASTQITATHPMDPSKPVTIPGYTQTNTPIPQLTEFFVNYASGIISFNAAASGPVSLSYVSLGENVDAVYINNLIDAINSKARVVTEKITLNYTSATVYTLPLSFQPQALINVYFKGRFSAPGPGADSYVNTNQDSIIVSAADYADASGSAEADLIIGYDTSKNLCITNNGWYGPGGPTETFQDGNAYSVTAQYLTTDPA